MEDKLGGRLPDDFADENTVFPSLMKKPVPIERIIQKLDAYFSHNDMEKAERHLLYWQKEAEAAGDRRGLFTIRDEQMGLYRKRGKKEEAFQAASDALTLAKEIGIMDTVAYGTALLNAATVKKAFGMAKEALPLYEEAEEIYFRHLSPYDKRLGGLYNNFALALAEAGMTDEAIRKNEIAIDIMTKAKSYPEAAISCLNLADCLEQKYGAEQGEEIIGKRIDLAESLLFSDENAQDGNYAYVCEKCAPIFDYYGRFLTAEECRERSKNIYERT